MSAEKDGLSPAMRGVFGVRSPAYSALFKKWEKLVHHMVRKYAWKLRFWFDYEDLVSVAGEALWRAHEGYDPNDASGAGFQTYARTIITNAMNRLHHYATAKMRQDQSKSFSIDDEEETYQLRSVAPQADARMIEEEQAVLVRSALGTLDGRQRKVIMDRLVKEKKLEEIGREMGVSRERVRQIERVALLRLSSCLGPSFSTSGVLRRPSLKIPAGRRPGPGA